MNRITLAGRLGKDPEVRFTSSGQKVTTLRLAVNQRRGGKDETMWWRVTVWGERFDKMMTYLKKGSALIVIGEMTKPQIYTDRDGNPQVSLDLVAVDLSFSPFGRSSETSSEGEPNSMMQNTFNEGMRNQGTPRQGEREEGEREGSSSLDADLSFSEEEIPF